MVHSVKKKNLSYLLEYFVVATNHQYVQVDIRMFVLTLKRLGYDISFDEVTQKLDSITVDSCPQLATLEKKLDNTQLRLLRSFYKQPVLSSEVNEPLPTFEEESSLPEQEPEVYSREKYLLRKEEQLLLAQKALDAKEASLMKTYGSQVNQDAIKVIHTINQKLQEYDKKISFIEQLEKSVSHSKQDLLQSQVDVQKQLDFLQSQEDKARQNTAQQKQKYAIYEQKVMQKQNELSQLQKRIDSANDVMNKREQDIALREKALSVRSADVRKKHFTLQNQMTLIQEVKQDLEMKDADLKQQELDINTNSQKLYEDLQKKLGSQHTFAKHQDAVLKKLQEEVSHLRKYKHSETAIKHMDRVKADLTKSRHALEKYTTVLEEVNQTVDDVQVGDFEVKNLLEMIQLGSTFLDSDLDRAKQIYTMIQETYTHLSSSQQKQVRNNVVSYYNSIIRRQRV